MLTKAQKKEHIAKSSDLVKNSKALVFADFTGAPTREVNRLKNELRKSGATYKVFKKRLLKIALKDSGVETDALSAKAQVATVFAKEDLTSVAGPIAKFAKELAKLKIVYKVLGAYDREGNRAIPVAEFDAIAKLPSREVLLAQVMGTMTGPLRKFMVALQEIAKKSAQGGSAAGGKETTAPAAPAAESAPAAEAAAAPTVA